MKKYILPIILAISVLTSALCVNATETLKNDIKADRWITMGGFTTSAGTFPAGTIADPVNNKYTDLFHGGSGEIRACNYNDVSAVYEEGTDANAVFKLGNAALSNIGVDTSKMKRYTVKFNYSSVEGTVVLHLINTGIQYWGINNTSGITLKDGGAYIYDTTKGELVNFVEDGTIIRGKWYTADLVLDVPASGYMMCNAVIYDNEGNILGESGFKHVCSAVGSSNYWQYNVAQHKASGFSTGYVLLDDWQVYSIDEAQRTEFTVDISDIELCEIKVTSSVALDADDISIDTVSLTSDDPNVDLEGQYEVSYDEVENSIVITTNGVLPYNTDYTVEIDNSIKTEDGILALSYPASFSADFSTSADPLTVDSCIFNESNGAELTLSNASVREREYMAIISVIGADGMYKQTKCVYGKIGANEDSKSVSTPYPDVSSGDTVKVMVWDNWASMNSICNTYEKIVE